MSDSTNKLEDYQLKLAHDFPDLSIESLKLIGSGWHHDAVEVNGGIVFRLPRGVHEAPSSTEIEISILQHMQGKLSVQIPEPLYISPNHEYFGYRKVTGALLDQAIKEFNDADWEQLKIDWVNLAAAIHVAISLSEARSLHIPEFIEPGPNPAEKIFQLESVENDVLEFATQTLDQLKQLNQANLQDTFIHNDLQFHNILVDQQTKRISGLIDWTDACIGPKSREFAVSEWWAKPGLLKGIIGLYHQQTGAVVDIKEVMLWRNLEEIADYAENTEVGEIEKAQQTLKRIKELMQYKTE